MRVVSGTYKGHPLKTLKGDATRPTTMRVKESLFSAITSALGSLEGTCVLDGFAGSGALGIEALSRGAASVVFFEQARAAAKIVRENLAKVGAQRESWKLEVGDAFVLASKKRARTFDLVLLDPPYMIAPSRVLSLVQALEEAGSLNAETLICYELAKKSKPELVSELDRLKWETVSLKDFGDTTYVLIRKGM